MKRQPDGRWRSTRQPVVITEAVLRARWVKAEVVKLKESGISFEAIALHITKVGRGIESPVTPFPPGIAFPPDYSISRQACFKLLRKALDEQPELNVEEFRKIDNARSDEIYWNLLPRRSRGDVGACMASIKVLDHQEKINGYAATRPLKQQRLVKEEYSLRPPISHEEAFELTKSAVKILIDEGSDPEFLPEYIKNSGILEALGIQDSGSSLPVERREVNPEFHGPTAPNSPDDGNGSDND